MKSVIDKIKGRAIYAFLVLMVIFFTIINPNFLTVKNLLNVAKQVSIFGIASVGMTYVILLGGIDLATGSIISFVNIVCAYFMVNIGMNVVLAVLLSLIISTFIGFLNGIIIAELRMPESFLKLGQGYVGPIPVPVIVMVVIFAIGTFILNKTYFGRYFYALGGNEEAALLSGIKIKVVKCLVYSLSGLFAGIAGLVMLARANTAQPNAGVGYEFDVITCVVLGGVSVNGGSGKMSNVIAGVLIIGVLSNGMVLMNISSYMQMVIKGIILLLAVGADCIQQMNLQKTKAIA